MCIRDRRYYPAGRIKLERRITEIETSLGPVRFKQVFEQGRLLRSAPEYDDCRSIARERSLPLKEVILQLTGQDLPD